MDAGEGIAWLLGIGIGIFVVWTVAVAALKVASYLVYIVPIVFGLGIAAGAVFAIATVAWVLWGGGSPPPVIRSPQKVAANEVFTQDKGLGDSLGLHLSCCCLCHQQTQQEAEENLPKNGMSFL